MSLRNYEQSFAGFNEQSCKITSKGCEKVAA